MGRLAKVGHIKLLTRLVWVAPLPGTNFGTLKLDFSLFLH
jgi:hypothetical protein